MSRFPKDARKYPVLELTPDDFQSDAARHQALAHIGACMLWPNSESAYPAHQHDREFHPLWANNASIFFESEPLCRPKQDGEPEVYSRDQCRELLQKLINISHALHRGTLEQNQGPWQSRYLEGVQIGGAVNYLFRSKGAPSFRLSPLIANAPPAAIGEWPTNVPPELRAKFFSTGDLDQALRHFALPARRGVKNNRAPKTAEFEGGADNRGPQSKWHRKRSVGHFWAAHLLLTYDDFNNAIVGVPAAFPCRPALLELFLLSAELIRRDAVWVQFPTGYDEMWVLPEALMATVVEPLRERVRDCLLISTDIPLSKRADIARQCGVFI